jgi:hypothetical protein
MELRANGEDRPDIRTACCSGCEVAFEATTDLTWIRVHAVIEEIPSPRRTTLVRYWHPRCYARRQHFLPQPIGGLR